MTDLDIAENCNIKPIEEIAASLAISKNELICYGKDKAKVTKEVGAKKGKLILVTAMSPTPYGEGKTTVSIGLADALHLLGEKVSLSLREPSLGPVFGIKGGATGGGYSQVVPMTDINLHFTGDFHAITACNNLISAAIYNHISQGNELNIGTILFERCLDVNDRSLRNISVLCNDKNYEDHFRITSASEIMALFCLASSLADLKSRLGKIIVGLTKDRKPITVHDLKLEGSLVVLLKDAFYPNLVQTLEGTPAFIHGGPFANIAHGCSSIRATTLALSLSDYVITEAGFGADLGAEKFLNIVCPTANIKPDTIVFVVTIRAIKHHGEGNLLLGLKNIEAHLDHLILYKTKIVVAINRFPLDDPKEIKTVEKFCKEKGILVSSSESYLEGGKGALTLANIIRKTCKEKNDFQPLVNNKMTIQEKLSKLATCVYHAKEIKYSLEALEKLKHIEELGFSYLPICVAKTQYSISDDAKKLGNPGDYSLHVRDLKINGGASFITVLLGNIMTMPGLPKNPNYEKIDFINGKITGLF